LKRKSRIITLKKSLLASIAITTALSVVAFSGVAEAMLSMNGKSLNGISLQGTTVQGTQLQSITVEGGQLVAVQRTAN
jgi:glucose-6-phosphate-specific signal transduction histidine kinase